MELTEHYGNLEQRDLICKDYERKGYRMLHDDFDEDWGMGDDPCGTLTFTDEPAEQAPVEPKLVFTASPPGKALGERLLNIENFLKEAYPE